LKVHYAKHHTKHDLDAFNVSSDAVLFKAPKLKKELMKSDCLMSHVEEEKKLQYH